MGDEIWIVDSDRSFQNSLVKQFERGSGAEITMINTSDLKKQLQRIQKTQSPGKAPILILLNSQLSKETVEDVKEWRKSLWPHQKDPKSPMIDFFIADDSNQGRVRTIRLNPNETHPDDYHFCLIDQLRTEIVTLAKRARLKRLHTEWGMVMDPASPLAKMKPLIDTLAVHDTTVLITGETGTGKELVARALHFRGRRSKRPFVALNCAAIPKELLESELFGTLKGAGTGTINRKGRIECADQGTFFFDEIGEMPLTTQAKLLRVIQEKQIQRLGSNTLLDIDVRFIAATNRNLEEQLRNGEFREDLYYRLNVFPIHLPPLRERGKKDIQVLIEYFLMNNVQKYGHVRKNIEGKALKALLQYPWPGNVRELASVIERAIIFSESRNAQKIKIADFGPDLLQRMEQNTVPSIIDSLPINYSSDKIHGELNPYNAVELTLNHREQIKLALEFCRGKITCAAKLLEEAGYKKGTSRGRLRNLLGLTETQQSADPELSQWFAQKYPNKTKPSD